MVISITQSSKIELADWLGIIGTTRRRGTILHKIRAIFHKIRAIPRLKQQR
jgi:hypothetical protein